MKKPTQPIVASFIAVLLLSETKKCKKNLLFIFFVLITSISFYGQNLIVNPGAELDPTTNGWTKISGSWFSDSYIAAYDGTYYFSCGTGAGTSELYQNIDVTNLASDIDAGNITFAFSGYQNTWNGSDQGRVIIEYRDVSNTVLSFYDTGLQNPVVWTRFSDSRVAPTNTRTVRVRLLSTRNQGNDSDGYVDRLELYAFMDPSTSNDFPLYGNVGIGTDSPDAKLAVNGDIHSKEVKVDLTNWPDYVFEDSYKLPSLKSVEAHIKEQGHLPNIPNALYVKKNGIYLGEMNAKLLEKIEELTLYTILQENNIEILENYDQTLEERVDKLEKTVDKLEKMIDKLEKIIDKYHRIKEK